MLKLTVVVRGTIHTEFWYLGKRPVEINNSWEDNVKIDLTEIVKIGSGWLGGLSVGRVK